MAKKQKKKAAKKTRSAVRRPSSKRAKSAKRTKPARSRGRKPAEPARPVLDLKALKAQLEAAVRVLSTRPSEAAALAAATEDVDLARAKMADFILSIEDICGRGGCGPHMVFPLN